MLFSRYFITLVQLYIFNCNSVACGFVSIGNSCCHQNEVGFKRLFIPASLCSSSNNGNNSNPDDDDNDEVLKKLTEKYLGVNPTFPIRKEIPTIGGNRPSKSDLYDDDELNRLLELHQEISPQTQQSTKDEGGNSSPGEYMIPSLHEMVLQTVQEIDDEQEEVQQQETQSSDSESQLPSSFISKEFDNGDGYYTYSWLTDDIRRKSQKIKAIASDVDGTLLSQKDQSMHPLTKQSILKAIESSFSPIGKLQHFFPATGKTRWGVLNSIRKTEPEIASLVQQCPGVYIQGLYCIDGNDNVVFEKKLTNKAIVAAESIRAKFDASIVAYDGDNLYSTALTDEVIELHEFWGEPMSTKIDSIADHENGVHKILVMDFDLDKISTMRRELEAIAKDHDACVTQAIPTMIEFLPEGCSKGDGVNRLCNHLGIDPTLELLSIGDAENDISMLQMSSIGVAVDNAGKAVKDSADVVLDETTEQGGAGLAMEVLGNI